ncbi:MAG: glycosyltransferase family 39 protein [Patescibacteria group bacterium]
MKKDAFYLHPFLKKNRFSFTDIALILILILGIFVRVWQIETKMIFFADAGRDMLAAVEMNRSGQIPLLGIPSSEPRFKQGPLFVWFEALVFKVGGPNPIVIGYLVAFLNSAVLLFCFVLLKKNVNITTALITTLLLATSPLAVAHSRMPYHITPIISCLLLYLWNIQRLIEKKPYAIFYTTLSFALLFQFELALVPLFLLVPITIWKTKNYSKVMILESAAGLTIGLLPQIIFDITNQFSQLGGFLVWLLRRLTSFFWIGKSHAFSLSQISIAWNAFIHYFSRIFSLDHEVIGLFFLIVLGASCLLILKFAAKNLFLQELSFGLILLLLALFIHGSPSEAYFPPIILLSCIVIGAGVSFLNLQWKICMSCFFIAIASMNVVAIVKNNFYILPNSSDFQYGTGYKEQVEVMKFVLSQSEEHPFQLRSTDPDAHFETYLDNFRVIGLSLPHKNIEESREDIPKKIFFINKHNSELINYPLAKITFFTTVDVIEIPNNI